MLLADLQGVGTERLSAQLCHEMTFVHTPTHLAFACLPTTTKHSANAAWRCLKACQDGICSCGMVSLEWLVHTSLSSCQALLLHMTPTHTCTTKSSSDQSLL